jgi:tetratricopeptide (TPR) repeat protein
VEAALALDPAVAENHQLHGMILLNRRRLRAGEAAIKTALSLNPDDVGSHVLLARIQEGREDIENAEAGFLLALRLKPESSLRRMEWAYFLKRRGRLSEAEREVRRVLAEAPDSSGALAIAADIALARSRDDDAVALVTAASRLDPDDPLAKSVRATLRIKHNLVLRWWWHWTSWIGRNANWMHYPIAIIILVTFYIIRNGFDRLPGWLAWLVIGAWALAAFSVIGFVAWVVMHRQEDRRPRLRIDY